MRDAHHSLELSPTRLVTSIAYSWAHQFRVDRLEAGTDGNSLMAIKPWLETPLLSETQLGENEAHPRL